MAIQLGDDAHYVHSTARLFGWQVDWQPRGLLFLRRGEWVARVYFAPGGGFVRSTVHGDAHEARELGLSDVIRLLEREGFAIRPSA